MPPDQRTATDAPRSIGADGGWQLGPLTGRAGKPAAQYIGATARAAERARRLAELDASMAEQRQLRELAAGAEAAAAGAARGIESWLAAVPPSERPHRRVDAAGGTGRVAERAERRADEAEQAAGRPGSTEAGRRRELHQLVRATICPPRPAALAARREALRSSTRRSPGSSTCAPP